MAINRNDVIDRLANVEKRCKVSVEVCLAKLDTSNREQVTRLEALIYNAQSKMDGTIYKNGIASVKQRETVTTKVSQLNERLANHEIVLARMESGLKQMEELEDRLIDTIRVDREDFEIRLGVLEDSSKALRKHWKTMDQLHTISRAK